MIPRKRRDTFTNKRKYLANAIYANDSSKQSTMNNLAKAHLNAFGLAEQTIDIAMFDEQHLADAIRFAKFGERPETCLEYKTGKTAKQDKTKGEQNGNI